jgi:Sodium/hydrogen exchanger family
MIHRCAAAGPPACRASSARARPVVPSQQGSPSWQASAKVLRRWTCRMDLDSTSLEHKFDTVGYGIFIPIFFITPGMTVALKALSQDPLRLLLFFGLLLIVRGLPSLLVYRRALRPPPPQAPPRLTPLQAPG